MKCILLVKLIFEFEFYDNWASFVWKIYVRTMLKKLEVYNQFDDEFF
jgi:VanZ family protein